jgi:molybdenum cofactor guanylyltransferase
MTAQANDVTALILAGGAGRRLGGTDKGLLPIDGQPLVVHVAAALAAQVTTIVISANRNLDGYRALGFPVVTDEMPGHNGPLAGFLSGLRFMQTPYLVTLPCDAPRVVPDLVPRLLRALQNADAEIAVAHDGSRLQSVHTLMTPAVVPGLCATLADGQRKVQDWIRRCRSVEVDFSDAADYFHNINTPEDYRLSGPLVG